MSKGTLDIGVVKVIKSKKTSHCESRAKEMQITLEWQIHSRSWTPTAETASRGKIAT
jgi:hypothetical protein